MYSVQRTVIYVKLFCVLETTCELWGCYRFRLQMNPENQHSRKYSKAVVGSVYCSVLE